MEAVRTSSVPSLHIPASFNKTQLSNTIFFNPTIPISSSSPINPKFTLCTTTSPGIATIHVLTGFSFPTIKFKVHTFKKACVAVYPSTVQNGIVWFWPNSDPQYKDIILKQKPPYIPELDDPSYILYEVLLMFHRRIVSYCKSQTKRRDKKLNSLKVDREGGTPLDMKVEEFSINGSTGKQGKSSSRGTTESPGKSRLICTFPRNFAVWIVPRWVFHIGQNLVLDSDEKKIMEIGPSKWEKACFVPTKTDAFVVGFRRWFNKYSGGQVDWRAAAAG